ncbi:CPBP family intramembrane glutamic endopeptidase [Francisella philomiragia]|uniref:CPBP family intramembrane glutamic endopeptidase n=1 Tax=Francisella philomiragia TaxID=28110 RepID=UPI001C9D826C|nr:type II CAAX endopeptidase family protein [Francisella philomiragia]MBY7735147.1 CPBP family intramembrane metalloprotease [Francisella philomiragia]
MNSQKGDYKYIIFLILSLLIGLLTNIVNLIGALILLLFLAFSIVMNKYNHIIFKIILALFAYLLMLHILPGFNNLNLYKNILVSPDAIPYSMTLKFDSLFVGLSIITVAIPTLVQELKYKIMKSILFGIFYGLLAILIIGGIAFNFNFVKWDIKFNNLIIIFIIQNLFFTCFYEEVFWRGLLQKNIFNNYLNKYLSILIIAILFATAHLIFANYKFAILAFFASIIYGLSYNSTNNLLASITTHYLVNITQIVLVTYPILASSLA